MPYPGSGLKTWALVWTKRRKEKVWFHSGFVLISKCSWKMTDDFHPFERHQAQAPAQSHEQSVTRDRRRFWTEPEEQMVMFMKLVCCPSNTKTHTPPLTSHSALIHSTKPKQKLLQQSDTNADHQETLWAELQSFLLVLRKMETIQIFGLVQRYDDAKICVL